MNRIELPSVPVGADKAALGLDMGKRSLGAALPALKEGRSPVREEGSIRTQRDHS